ncbi:MAG: alpha-amylase, partial [Anaerolineae bacterium]|nr:alpha-amylase [Anaerolineae bacterium]
MAHESHESHLIEESTRDLIAWAQAVEGRASSPFEAARKIATRLGAHYRDGHAEIGFWVPELVERGVPGADIFLQVWNPVETVDLQSDMQTVRFRRQRVSLLLADEYAWGIIAGMRPGSRSVVGSFYELIYQDAGGVWHTILDPLAYSVPFGTFAPAEFYDVDLLHNERTDSSHFACLDAAPDPDGIPRVRAPVNILQMHVSTASEEGTLSGLMRIYDTIADKLRAGEPLSPGEDNYVGYDAVQLMPLEPTIEYETGPLLWEPIEDDPDAETVAVTLRRPNMTNWGYDVML